MKNIIDTINESSNKSKYTYDDFKEALDYFGDYYKEFPEEKGAYPNWGELDNYFSNEKWCQALMDEEKDPAVEIVDRIFDVFFAK